MFRLLSSLGVVICLLSLTYGWIKQNGDIPNRNRTPFCNWSLCKRPRYFVLVFGSAVSMLGFPVANFFLADRAKAYGIHESQSKWFYVVFGIFGITFGLIAGKIGDMIIRYHVILNISSLLFHGFLRDATGTFKLPLIIAGCLEIVGALISFPVARVKIGDEPGQDNHENSENNNNI
ncbi:uncharacterized protein LOC114541948 [Dendronephthya gigantea]|uniref:uncharacterized protein LOC114541948 n=1 Tax=Dendronephthya gigantea TaxID=151771 RepID=UPI00106C6ADA|nr:uncharacterized protein LOC114541948 [Dendronephthya gigantea]